MWTPADEAQASSDHSDGSEREVTVDDGVTTALQLEDEREVDEEDDAPDKTCSSASIRGQTLPSVKHSTFSDVNNSSQDVFLRRSSELDDSSAPGATRDLDGRPFVHLEQDDAIMLASRPPSQALVNVREDAASGDRDTEFDVVKAEVGARSASKNNSSAPPNEIRGYAVVPFADILLPDFAHRERLGLGTYGTVDKAYYKGRAVAAKRMQRNTDLIQIHKEADLLEQLRHENIVKILALFHGEEDGLVLELMEGGSLHELLHERPHVQYFECHVLGWAQQVAAALRHLHRNGYLHRDLKPRNTLLSDDFRTLKLCDFGTITELRASMTNNCGSAYWMAPEVFRDTNYDQKCDIFSFAVLLWEIAARRQPYSEQDFDNVHIFLFRVVHGLRPPRISKCPDPIMELIERCWQHNASERPDVEELVNIIDILCELCPDRCRPLVDKTTKQQAFAHSTEQPSSPRHSPGHFYLPAKQGLMPPPPFPSSGTDSDWASSTTNFHHSSAAAQYGPHENLSSTSPSLSSVESFDAVFFSVLLVIMVGACLFALGRAVSTRY